MLYDGESQPSPNLMADCLSLGHLRVADVRNVPVDALHYFGRLFRRTSAGGTIFDTSLVLRRFVYDVKVVLVCLVYGQ